MIARYRKGIVSFVGAGVAALVTAYLGDSAIDGGEWVAALVAALGTLGITVTVPNTLSASDLRRQPNLPPTTPVR